MLVMVLVYVLEAMVILFLVFVTLNTHLNYVISYMFLGLRKNLMSIPRICLDNNVLIAFYSKTCVIKDLSTNQVIYKGTLKGNGLHSISLKYVGDVASKLNHVAFAAIASMLESMSDVESCNKCSVVASISDLA